MVATERHREAGGIKTAVRVDASSETGRRQRPYLWHPEFWIAIALAAVLRLWALDATHFLFDQATLMTLARDAVLSHALPVAGLSSSIHTLNPPINVYLLMPFVLFGTNPLPAVVALALWNVLGVALSYVFALRYFGRRVAAVGSLLFAVGPAAVEYSRFLWPQNYLPPLLTLYALAVFAGCVRGKRGMLAPAVLLLALGALLHPTALLLAPALLAGVLFAPHRPRWREYALSAAIVAALLLPTVIWELASGWSDLHLFATYSSGQAKIDPEVFFRLYEALGAPALPLTGSVPHAPPHSLASVLQLLAAPITSPPLGSSAPYQALAPLYVALGLAALLLFSTGWLALTARILAPAWTLWKGAAPSESEQTRMLVRLGAWAGAVWRGLRADTAWRAFLLLWLLVTAPLALLIRHSSPIFTHYLIALYPFVFLTMALGVAFMARIAARLAGRLRVRAPTARGLRLLLLALVAALILGQAAQSLLYTVSIATGQFDARAAGYGYPLGALQQADARLSQLQRQAGATSIYIAESLPERVAMNYTLVREHPDRVGFVDACLILPPTDAGPALVVAARGSQDDRALASLPNTALLAAIPMAGNTPLMAYRVAGASPPTLPGETALAPARFQDASGQGLQLDAGRIEGRQVRLRWTALAATPLGAVPLMLRAQVRDATAGGQISHVQAFRDCAPARWQAGATVFTWLPLPPSWSRAQSAPPDTLLIQVQESTTAYATPTFGSIHLLSSAQMTAPWRIIPAQLPAGQPSGGHSLTDGGVVVSEGNFGEQGA